MANYADSKIYKIISIYTLMIYIGSTTQSLSKRLGEHKTNYKKGRNKSSKHIIKLGGYKIILIHNFNCNNRDELRAEEQRVMDLYKREDLVNYIKAYLTPEQKKEYDKQYNEANKETIQEYNKQHYENNKQKIQENRKKYYENNKQKILEKHKQHYENNKQKIQENKKQYRKQHYENNKQKIQENSKQYRDLNSEYINRGRRCKSYLVGFLIEYFNQ